VAAAAREEAGLHGAPEPPRPPRSPWPVVAIVAGVLLVLMLCAGATFLSRSTSVEYQAPVPVPATPR
jgi:hypothetical protein